MKVGFICSDYPPGPHTGIGTMTQILARALVKAGHQVRVLGVCYQDYPAPDYEDDQGVQVWRLRNPTLKLGMVPGRFDVAQRLGWIPARFKLFSIVSRWSKHGAVDLFDVPDFEGMALGWPRLSVPVIVRLNGSESYMAAEQGKPLRRSRFWLERASLHRADFWCSVSRYIADKTQQLFQLGTGPSAILYNPVELPVLSGAVRAPNKVIFSGTLTAKKGVISLVKAWPQVVACCPDAELHVYGKDHPMEDGSSTLAHLRSLLNTQVAPSVQFHGYLSHDHLLQTLQTARVAVFPSYAEAFAIAPMEAMAAECSTIYSTRGSGRELIDEGQDGLLVEPDHPDEIAEAIGRILSDDLLAERLGRAGRHKIERQFSIQALLPQNEAFYADCIVRFGKGQRASA